MLVAVGLSQNGATLSDRERLVIPAEELSSAIAGFAALCGLEEIVLLSTCHRVEVYAATRCPAAAALGIRQAMTQRSGRELPLVELHGREALRHLFRVTSSLESAVFGEAQILGQVKVAHARAAKAGAAGHELNRVMSRAFEVAKRVRTETAVGRAGISWGHAASMLAEKVLGPVAGRRAIVVGAGEMARVSAQHLREQGAEVSVVNRTAAHAESLARDVGAAAVGLDVLEDELRRADVVVSAVPAAPVCFAAGPMSALMRGRRGRPLVVVDLAVPRVIPAEVGRLEGIYLCDVDDLARVAEAAAAERSAALAAADRIIEEELQRWAREEAERRAAPIIHAMRTQASAIAREEVAKTLRRLGEDPELETRLNALAGAIISKLLHAPSARLRRAGADGPPGEALMAAAMQIFDVAGEAAAAPTRG